VDTYRSQLHTVQVAGDVLERQIQEKAAGALRLQLSGDQVYFNAPNRITVEPASTRGTNNK
jgi:hypothetical protein